MGHPATISERIPIPLNLRRSNERVKVYGLEWTLPPRSSSIYRKGKMPLAQKREPSSCFVKYRPVWACSAKLEEPEILKASARRGTKNASTHGAQRKMKNRD